MSKQTQAQSVVKKGFWLEQTINGEVKKTYHRFLTDLQKATGLNHYTLHYGLNRSRNAEVDQHGNRVFTSKLKGIKIYRHYELAKKK